MTDAEQLKYNFENQQQALHVEYAGIKDYIEETETNIRKLQKNLLQKLNVMTIENKDADDWAEIEEFFDSSDNYNVLFPSMFHNSTMIWLYSFFENKLKKYCEVIEKHSRHKIKVKDFGRRGVDRYEKYIRLVNGIDSPKLTTLWNGISNYAAIRNLIVHNNSSIIQNSEKSLAEQPSFNIISQNGYLMINEDNETFSIFMHHYLTDFAGLIIKYFDELCTEIMNKAEQITQ